ncbi:MAG: hypothetical protein J5582_03140 [Ruminococcus sp.]|nr:hypothetical protein [Ruminococcus sp.]
MRIECQGRELWVKPFAKGLREPQSAKLTVKGRALNHQGAKPKCIANYKSDTNSYQICAGNTKRYERVPKYTTVSFGMSKHCQRMKSDSDSEFDFSTRKGRLDTVVPMIEISNFVGIVVYFMRAKVCELSPLSTFGSSRQRRFAV